MRSSLSRTHVFIGWCNKVTYNPRSRADPIRRAFSVLLLRDSFCQTHRFSPAALRAGEAQLCCVLT